MDVDTFWSLIENAHEASGGDTGKQAELLTQVLSQFSEQELIEFDRIVYEMMWRSYQADLWEAAWVIGCGCSDDGFFDFRGWLIAQGKHVFEEAIRDPETVAEVVEANRRYEFQ